MSAAASNSASSWHGIGAAFPSASALYHAAEGVRDRGFYFWDVYSPFPIHGMDKAMGLGKSKVSMFSLAGGAIGLTTAVLLQVVTSVLIYPMVVQGKPYLSLPAFVPVMFELTILLTAFGTVVGLLLLNLLPRFHHPVFNWEAFSRVSDDGFFLIIEAEDPHFDPAKTADFLRELGGTEVTLIPKEDPKRG